MTPSAGDKATFPQVITLRGGFRKKYRENKKIIPGIKPSHGSKRYKNQVIIPLTRRKGKDSFAIGRLFIDADNPSLSKFMYYCIIFSLPGKAKFYFVFALSQFLMSSANSSVCPMMVFILGNELINEAPYFF
jgi:hypothetical protein